jgi:hypothetical protein
MGNVLMDGKRKVECVLAFTKGRFLIDTMTKKYGVLIWTEHVWIQRSIPWFPCVRWNFVSMGYFLMYIASNRFTIKLGNSTSYHDFNH